MNTTKNATSDSLRFTKSIYNINHIVANYDGSELRINTEPSTERIYIWTFEVDQKVTSVLYLLNTNLLN